jgi:hypothetical protein
MMARFAASPIARAVISSVSAAVVALSLITVAPIASPTVASDSVAQAADNGPRLDRASVPVRVQVRSVGVDLPVVSSERNVRGNVRNYPLCDVAQYWTRYDLPGKPGTTWIYAHAQPGMFLPLFTESEATDGTGLIGDIIELQLKDGRLLRYRINEVRERATGRRIAGRPNPSQHRLVLQTSTGPPGTVPKLQVAARLVEATRTKAPAPKPQPRACSQPASGNGGNRGPGGAATQIDTPTVVVAPSDDSIEPMALVLGSGAVLVGATLVAVYLVRRQP